MQSNWVTDYEINERQLIANFKNGNLHNNELIYLLGYITQYIRRSHNSLFSEADDIASEAVLEAYENIDSLKDDVQFFPWAKGIAHNVALQRHKKLRQLRVQSRDGTSEAINDESPEEVQALQEQAGIDDEAWLRTMALKEARASLSDEQRAVITLRIDEQHSFKEVAEQLNLTNSYVRQIEFRACKKMRDYLTLNGYADLFPTATPRRRSPAKPVFATNADVLGAGA